MRGLTMTEPWTPGPWSEDWNAPRLILASNGSGRHICAMPEGYKGKTREAALEDMANARLIAAAPEMAELLATLPTVGHPEWCSFSCFGGEEAKACDCWVWPTRTLLSRIRGEDTENP